MKADEVRLYALRGGLKKQSVCYTHFHSNKVFRGDLMSYENDFVKHAEPTDVPKIQLIWDSLPLQLARENKKFLYSAVKDGVRAREYENALNWLYNADLVRKTFRISKPGLPLSEYDDLTAFKIYMSDVGLLRKHSHLATSAFADSTRSRPRSC